MKRILVGGGLLLVLLGFPARARADLTAFVGVNGSPSNRTVTGLAVGVGVIVVGIEFEYSDSREDPTRQAPSLRTGMVNAMLQTPNAVAGIRPYFTIGGGAYKEQLGDREDTSWGTNLGGGAKIALAGPIQIRLDYRIFSLKGTPLESKPQRFYVGVNVAF